jgi:predicted DNA binding protein
MAYTPPPEKIMFEIYKDVSRNGDYQVIYFTELDDHTREVEINRAANGEHVYDGFIRNRGKDQAKLVLGSILERLNNGESLQAAEIERELQPYMP